jgi:hypothetical protein
MYILLMRVRDLVVTVAFIFAGLVPAHSENIQNRIKDAVKRSTLNQSGTKPFHLKATLAPSFERDKDSGRTGEIEIWWASPTQWKREVRSPEFHQIQIVNGTQLWQKNEGQYFPEWLRNIAVELVDPIPDLERILEQVKSGEIRNLAGQTSVSWTTLSSNGTVQKGMGAGLALNDRTGLLFYGSDLGWGAEFQNYTDFHGRMVAQTVKAGSPEVTAKVVALEDLGDIPTDFFDTHRDGGDTQPLQAVVVDEIALRRNLLPGEPLTWPPLQDGPLEGILTTEVVIDREGKVRDSGTIVTDNPGVSDAARTQITKMQFKPYLVNGVPVQVISRITMQFKTVRPAGTETFESARSYFEHGRLTAFPSAGNGTAYILHAEFEAKGSSGTIEHGRYEDTWAKNDQWRREAWFGKSHYVRAQDGEKRYELAEGSDVGLLRLMLKAMEPIPATDTFIELDWRIKSDTVDGIKTIRVLTGYESPDGKLDPVQVRGYWFDEAGNLIKTYFKGVETRRSDFQDFRGAKIAHQIDVLSNGALGMRIHVVEVAPLETIPEKSFDIKGHEYKRAFTDEMR